MVKIWQMDEVPQGDHRLPNMAFPPKYLTSDRLKKRTGVFLWKIGLGGSDTANCEGAITQMEWINKEYKYVMDNVIEIKEGVTQRLSDKITEWYQPHTHNQDESRLVLDGQAYYDVEDPKTGKWLRVMIERGDFIVIPAGCIHRFTTDMTNHIKMKRFYQTPEGEPHPVSPTNCHQLKERVDYLNQFHAKGTEGESTKNATMIKEAIATSFAA